MKIKTLFKYINPVNIKSILSCTLLSPNFNNKGVCLNYVNYMFRQYYFKTLVKKEKYGIILPYILNYLDLNIDSEAEFIIQYATFVALLSLICLFSILNIILYISINYYLNISKIKTKLTNYPKLIKIIKYYQKTSIIFIIVDLFVVIMFLIAMIIFSIIILKNNIK